MPAMSSGADLDRGASASYPLKPTAIHVAGVIEPRRGSQR
jgi:hypothetical protein